MKQKNTFIPTTRELSSNAEAISHKLLLKAGMIKQVSAGVYTYLPLANNVIEKVKKIIREEHDNIDAAELVMPILQSKEYWEESGRWAKMGDELMRIKDRKDADYALSPTAEEIIVQTVKNMITSYKQLPLNLYQIQTKFRDEIRPRLGLLRGKEFIMKDAYSFHDTQESLDKTYDDMYGAYEKIFDRCNIKYRAVQADSGNIGGSNTHEFQALAEIGEDTIVYTEESNYAANIETAAVHESNYTMPNVEKKQKELLETPNQQTIEEIAAYLGVKPENTMKALAIKSEGKYYLILLRGDHQLSDVKLKKHTGISEYEMTTEEEIIEVMGSYPGYMGPIGVKNVTIYADNAVKYLVNHSCGANKKGFHYINTNVEDYTVDGHFDLRDIKEGEIAEDLSGKVKFAKGIEVGQVFKLGTIYSEAMNATFLDQNGKAKPFVMGCYGIGVSRLLSAVVEQSHDEHGIIWPKEIAPYQVHLLCLDMKKEEQEKIAEEIYNSLRKKGVEVLYDNRNERAGVKFNDADLIGIPYQIIVGKNAENGVVEIKERRTLTKEEISVTNIVEEIMKRI